MTTQYNNQPHTIVAPMIDGKWIGVGISYGAYRDGESPHKGSVTTEQDILEDLTLLTTNHGTPYHLIRMYGADPASEQVLKTIRKYKLPVKVMQGAWVAGSQSEVENELQISQVIRLANDYSDIVIGVNVGNEIFVDWSAHKFEIHDIPMYLEWVKRVQKATKVPVTLADDYNFWNKPHSQKVAEALDFIVLHAYAMWNSQALENAMPWTQGVYANIQAQHPTKQIVLGESGWATSSVSTNADERLIIGQASPEAQKIFFDAYRAWLEENKIVSFYFEAFDERWKGGEEMPNGIAEKNWGIYHADRTPKLVVKSSL
jgi:exo-beta-1,3-glucanase (GH17 family)